MPQFRYEAVDRSGVPIHGTAEAFDRLALESMLQARGLTLVSTAERSLQSVVATQRKLLPRIFQLRLGEQLQEAVLTGVPAHEAVRAMAAEPFEHPVLTVMPALIASSAVGTLGFAAAAMVTNFPMLPAVLGASITVVALPLVWALMRLSLVSKPQAVLRSLATQLEAGESSTAVLQSSLPPEIRELMKAELPLETRANAAADLMPSVFANDVSYSQLGLKLLAPFMMFALSLIAVYGLFYFGVWEFRKLFMDFDTDLPGLTLMFVSISASLRSLGPIGMIVFAFVIIGMVAVAILLTRSRRAAYMMSGIPVVGISFRWAAQARVARAIAALIRRNADYPETIRVATRTAGFPNIKAAGEHVALSLENGEEIPRPPACISGLPFSMLATPQGSAVRNEERRQSIGGAFENLGAVLNEAALGQGQFAVMITKFALVAGMGLFIGLLLISMFLPLFKLMNDLA